MLNFVLKLDPMGLAFGASATALSTYSSGGRLVYTDRETSAVINLPAKGLGDIAQLISQQRAYADCQVRRFWKWFIGEDRPLTPTRRDELIKEFDRVGRRTNDFISVLVQAPEFRNLDFRTPSQQRVDEVKVVLQRCVDCHSSEDQQIPSFTTWPIGGDATKMARWLKKIDRALDLANDGKNRDMPPDYSAWQPTLKDLQLIKSWIGDKAPDENGRPQI